MRAWKKTLTIITALILIIFITANLALYHLKTPNSGRPYRVEINRIMLQIEKSGLESVDLSQYHYVYHIEKFNDTFFDCDSDYSIRIIDGTLYRFDYTVKNNVENNQIIIIVNILFIIMTLAVFSILFYMREKILRPFDRLTNVPYELSKGNLTSPLKENKNRFFGKFFWGIDLLRENIEQQKQRELELQKEKKTLLLSLSHDIKTPLSAIKLYSKALSKNLYSNTEKQREIAENINKNADEIESYITQIIAASKEDFLSLDVTNSEFYLSDLIENITAYYREKLTLIKMEFIVGKYKNCLLFGDLDRSVEVLQNIVENALKYGTGKCLELLFPEEESGVLITVKNDGCTLDSSELPHIFESFWRGANSKNIQGSGLGLYICRQLMHKMNGEIFAEIDGEIIAVTAVFNRI